MKKKCKQKTETYSEIIMQLRETNYKFKDVILNNLFHWINIVSEEEEEDLNINLKSSKNLCNFMDNEILNLLPSPKLILASEGTLRLEWIVERNKKFLGIRFLPKEFYSYVLFSPSIEREDFISRESGFCDKSQLKKIIENISWI